MARTQCGTVKYTNQTRLAGRQASRQADTNSGKSKMSNIKSEHIIIAFFSSSFYVLFHSICSCSWRKILDRIGLLHWNGKLIIGDNLQRFLPVSFGRLPHFHSFHFSVTGRMRSFFFSFIFLLLDLKGTAPGTRLAATIINVFTFCEKCTHTYSHKSLIENEIGKKRRIEAMT